MSLLTPLQMDWTRWLANISDVSQKRLRGFVFWNVGFESEWVTSLDPQSCWRPNTSSNLLHNARSKLGVAWRRKTMYTVSTSFLTTFVRLNSSYNGMYYHRTQQIATVYVSSFWQWSILLEYSRAQDSGLTIAFSIGNACSPTLHMYLVFLGPKWSRDQAKWC